MIQLNNRLKATIKIGAIFMLILGILGHTSLFNHYLQKTESQIWLSIRKYFKMTPLTPQHKISFHLTADVAALQELIHTATELCKARGLNLAVKKFYHYGDLSLLKAQTEESLAWGAEAVISVGGTSAQNIHTLLSKRNAQIPHIFSCVPNPKALGISEGEEYTGTNSTGVAEDPTGLSDAFFKSFMHIRPDAKKIIILHSVTTEAWRTMIADMINGFAERNIQAAGLYASNIEEVARIASTHITRDIDAVIILRDGLVVSALQSILKACRLTGTTTFVSDSHSVKNGAAAGCCVEEADIGLLVGEIIMKVVHDKLPAGQLPITYFNTASLCKTYVNQYEMHAQGMHNRSIYDLMMSEQKLEFLHVPKK